jgi:Stress responsive A/B Barrel Domain
MHFYFCEAMHPSSRTQLLKQLSRSLAFQKRYNDYSYISFILHQRFRMIGHMVYFALKDSSLANRTKLVEACKKHLTGHEGTVYFAAGVLAEEFAREVNDRQWDVALHLVFQDKAAHDQYQDHPRHEVFIKENKETWKSVRVFDSLLG